MRRQAGAWSLVAVLIGSLVGLSSCGKRPVTGPRSWDVDVRPPSVTGSKAPFRRGAVEWMDGPVVGVSHTPLTLRDALRVEFDPRVRRKYDLDRLDHVAGARKAGWKPGVNDPYKYFHKTMSVGIEIDQQVVTERDLTSIDPGGTRRAAYMGTLHSHSNLSDGRGPPADAYAMARDVAGVDFFGVSDHAEYFVGPAASRWTDLRREADRATTPTFVGVAGFEYSNLWWGHYVVFNTNEAFPYRYWSWGVGAFYDWLAEPAQREALAVFAHPGFHVNHMVWEHASYRLDPRLVDRFVGIDVTHMGAWLPDVLGHGRGMSFFDEALSKGWRLGPMAAPDNHYPNWGVRDSHRIGVLLPRLTRDELFRALRERRFYATTNEGIQATWGAWLRGGAWAVMGERVARESFGDGPWTFEFRFCDASSKHALRVFEVIVDGAVEGRLMYPALPSPVKRWPVWAFWKKAPIRKGLDPMTPAQAGSVKVRLDPAQLDPKRSHVVSVRLQQGSEGEHVTVMAPVFIEPAAGVRP